MSNIYKYLVVESLFKDVCAYFCHWVTPRKPSRFFNARSQADSLAISLAITNNHNQIQYPEASCSDYDDTEPRKGATGEPDSLPCVALAFIPRLTQGEGAKYVGYDPLGR